MIITEQKSMEEIDEMIKPFQKLFIVGCGTCSTSCKTGGEEEVKEMVEKLGEKVNGWSMVEDPCDFRLCRRDLRDNKKELADTDAVLVMACGAGIQTVNDFTEKITLPGLNTLFIGQTQRIGKYYDTCKACGDCILDETGGVCPITRCAKELLNGPCGGQVDGKCEVGDYKNECAWIQIYDKLVQQDRLELFKIFRPPRDFSKKTLKINHFFN
jgi:hypothetical protein